MSCFIGSPIKKEIQEIAIMRLVVASHVTAMKMPETSLSRRKISPLSISITSKSGPTSLQLNTLVDIAMIRMPGPDGPRSCVDDEGFGVCLECGLGEGQTMLGCPCAESNQCGTDLQCFGGNFPLGGYCWTDQGPPDFQCEQGRCGQSFQAQMAERIASTTPCPATHDACRNAATISPLSNAPRQT